MHCAWASCVSVENKFALCNQRRGSFANTQFDVFYKGCLHFKRSLVTLSEHVYLSISVSLCWVLRPRPRCLSSKELGLTLSRKEACCKHLLNIIRILGGLVNERPTKGRVRSILRAFSSESETIDSSWNCTQAMQVLLSRVQPVSLVLLFQRDVTYLLSGCGSRSSIHEGIMLR